MADASYLNADFKPIFSCIGPVVPKEKETEDYVLKPKWQKDVNQYAANVIFSHWVGWKASLSHSKYSHKWKKKTTWFEIKNQIFILYKLFSNQICRSQVSGSQKHPQIADLHVLSPFQGQVAKS